MKLYVYLSLFVALSLPLFGNGQDATLTGGADLNEIKNALIAEHGIFDISEILGEAYEPSDHFAMEEADIEDYDVDEIEVGEFDVDEMEAGLRRHRGSFRNEFLELGYNPALAIDARILDFELSDRDKYFFDTRDRYSGRAFYQPALAVYRYRAQEWPWMK